MDGNIKNYETLLLELSFKAINSKEIQASNEITDVFRNYIQEKIKVNSKKLLSNVSSDINNIEKIRESLSQSEEKLILPISLIEKIFKKFPYFLVILSFVLFIATVVGKYIDIPYISGILSAYSYWEIILIWIGSIVFCAFLLFGFESYIENKKEERLKTLKQKLNIPEREQTLKQAEEQLSKKLFHEIVFPFVRENIASLRDRSYSTNLSDFTRSGLSEVHDIQYEVPTETIISLGRLIDEMRGGCIGISGPRGAGKTTILRSVCKPDLPDIPMGEKSIKVMVSAPVKYGARDFILHLFSNVCYSVLEIFGGKKTSFNFDSHTDRKEWHRSFRNRQLNMLLRIVIILTFLGVLSVGIGGIGFFYSITNEKPISSLGGLKPLKVEGQLTSEDIVRSQIDGKMKVVLNFTVNKDAPKKANQTSKINVSLQTVKQLITKNMGVFFRWGIYLLTLSLFLNVSRPWLAIALRKFFYRSEEDFYEPVPGIDDWKAPEEWQGVLQSANNYITDIKFQQSYSSGWQGSLSIFPMGLSQNETETLTARQKTLPDIISDFRSLIESLPISKPIILAIDELDKMESPEEAESFLNDIKSIFGIRNCIYLISVSQSAMSRFERRGLPFRDTFDSSFDEIIQTRYFSFKKSIQLLNQRVIGESDHDNPWPSFNGKSRCHIKLESLIS